MSMLNQMDEWSIRHHPKWLVVLRIVLGFCLFIKGFSFIKNSVLLPAVISETPLVHNAPWLASFIPWVHILGGSMLLVGLFTRLSCLVQIPILIGAVFFVNLKMGMYSTGSELLFSVMVLILLVFFFIEGGGPLSMDNYFRNYWRINKE